MIRIPNQRQAKEKKTQRSTMWIRGERSALQWWESYILSTIVKS